MNDTAKQTPTVNQKEKQLHGQTPLKRIFMYPILKLRSLFLFMYVLQYLESASVTLS